MNLKYNVGDDVWCAITGTEQKFVKCDHCAGSGVVKVIFGDGEEASINCQNCSKDHWIDCSPGKISYSAFFARPEKMTVVNVEIRENKIKYGVKSQKQIDSNYSGWYVFESTELCDKKEDAEIRAAALAEERTLKELNAANNKVKDYKSWAWNASYHRKCIKEAQKNIDRHTAALNVASVKAKEAKEAKEEKKKK